MTDPLPGVSSGPTRRARRIAVTAVAGLALLVGCTEDGQLDLSEIEAPDIEAPDIEAPDIEAPEVEAPEVEAPEPEAPAVETPDDGSSEGGDTDTDTDGDGLTTGEWILLIALGVGVIAVIIGATSAANSHSERKSRERSERQRQTNDVVGGCRWVIDQGAPMVLTSTDGAQAQNVWASVRPRLLETEQSIARYGAGSGDDDLDHALSRLGLEVAGLRGALDAYVSALASGRQDLTDQAQVTVNDRRRNVETALQPVAQTRH